MTFTLANYDSLTITICLFIAIIVFYWLAGMIALKRKSKNVAEDNVSPVESSLLGLLALLLAFTFSMSASRYDTRRHILIDEANNIGTAILRADLYADTSRLAFRNDFKDYVEARIAFYDAGVNKKKINNAQKATDVISDRIWKRAALLAQNKENLIASNQMIPALNAMIDIVTSRNAAGKATVPDSILWMLFLLCLISSFIMGYHKNHTSKFVIIVFSLMISACIYLIIDLDRPRQGLINIDAANSYIVDLRKMFKS